MTDLGAGSLWRGNHVAVKQLVEDFARYPYLQRLRDGDVLLAAMRERRLWIYSRTCRRRGCSFRIWLVFVPETAPRSLVSAAANSTSRT